MHKCHRGIPKSNSCVGMGRFPIFRCIVLSDQIDFSDETKLSASQEEEAGWKKEREKSHADASTSSGGSAGPPEYHFICQVRHCTPGWCCAA